MVIIARLLVTAYLALIGYCVYRAANGRPRLYWLAAVLLYAVSLLFAWSIGGFMVAGVFALVGAGLVHVLKTTPRPRDVALGAGLGIAAWTAWIALGDITWVFWPVAVLFGG